MATTALNSWNAIKARQEALNKDAKFKPDKLTALCARLDDLGAQLAKQEDEKGKARKIVDDAGNAYEAASKKMTNKYDEIQKIADQMAETDMDGDLDSDDAVKVVSKASAGFVTLAKELSEVAQALAKASDELAGIVKKMAEQFKAKRESIEAATKKIKADGSKTQDLIKQQVDAYRKIAAGMKDNDLAGDIGSLSSITSQLYTFQ